MTRCYHVTTARGEVYGVAATSKTEARLLLQDRLTKEESNDAPETCHYVGAWDADFGTVLWY